MTDNDYLQKPIKQSELVHLLRTGAIGEDLYRQARKFAGFIPDKANWRAFLATFLAAYGAIFLLSGIIFFFAYNWVDLTKWHKFALLQSTLLISAAFTFAKGLDSLTGKISLTFVAGLIGALFALFGQTYQTGADAYQLFVVWAAFMLPLAFIGHFSPLWFLLLCISNLAASLFVTQELGGSFEAFGFQQFLVAMNLGFLVAWEVFAGRGASWMQGRWFPNILLMVVLLGATSVMTHVIIRGSRYWGADMHPYTFEYATGTLLYLSIIATSFWYYQVRKKELFPLTLCVFSLGILSFIWLTKHMRFTSGNDLLVYGLIILAESGLAAMWLRKKHRQWAVGS